MDERERIAERLKALATVEVCDEGELPTRVRASYLGVEGFGFGSLEPLWDLADKLLQVRDHVALMLAEDIDPSKRQRLPRVVL